MSSNIEYISNSASITKKIGNNLAKTILGQSIGEQAVVVALKGDLGAGKTQFSQGVAKELGVKEAVNSPTFSIMKKYPLKKNKNGFKNFYHIDCYRLDSQADLAHLGIEDILIDPKNIVAVEWPKIIENLLPKSSFTINFEAIGKNKRKITIYGK